ncbi:MAG: branched-chain amino acid ABC transporter permease [Chloroflexi bacterium]|nr:branched-chain amino acid ABC transporter permease [Chloroflexota bacterium]
MAGPNAAFGVRGRPLASEQTRRLLLFVGVLMVVLAYPPIDRLLRLETLGAVVPIFMFVILALGLNIVVGYAGLLDLGYAAFFAIGAYTAAFLTSPVSPLPFRTDFWVAMVLSFVVAALFGVVLGAPTLRLRGDYLAIVTLAFGEIVPRVFLNAESLTGGAKGIKPIGFPTFFGVNFVNNQVAWYYLVIAVGAFSVWMISRLADSRIGRAWMAMREDEIAAASMGINLVTTKLLAFAMGASFSGFAGSVFASMFQYIDPGQFEFQISIMVLSMVILGGMGNMYGVVIGGILLASFDRILAERATDWIHQLGSLVGSDLAWVDLKSSKMMIFGLALVLTMLLRPEGLIPNARRRAELHAANNRGAVEGEAEPAGPATPPRDGARGR